ncbi:4-alpha-glucanotransferase [Leptospira ryugenii]|uniref:4-alpha-glucanotransferase n=2 Tax=Leptospira ryugenii TaxID=1917863 RepID=A0A2P2DY16_9LEPT|nr:4-alpha-glucanotransferase [Leptospira ryugenii]
MAEWAKSCGFSLLQILPLNDTGNGNSPYSSISAYAIDPIYISLHDLGLETSSRRERIGSHKIHPQRIREIKLKCLRDYFTKRESAKDEASKFLDRFPWAYSYVAFRVLYDLYEGKDWTEWKEEHRNFQAGKDFVFAKERETAFFYAFVQSLAFQQLSTVKSKLEEMSVFLKGDMPILTSRNSADVWESPECFQLDLKAGAPPDAFSEEGQNWGFPILNWEYLRKTDYLWWRNRVEYLEHFFHLFRIDHVIGMYRIWAIPAEESSARKGWFSPQMGASKEEFASVGLDPEEFVQRGLIRKIFGDRYIFYWDFWKEATYQNLDESVKSRLFPLSEIHLKEDEAHWREAGEDILSALDRFTQMVPCAEDLGAVPGFIRDSLQKRETLGIDVVRWTRSLENGTYIQAKDYRRNAISVLSTHDTSLSMDWWDSLTLGEKEYAHEFFFGNSLPETSEEIQLGLLKFALSTNSLFSIQMLQDLLYPSRYGIQEDPKAHRINVPGTENESNWTYRFSFHLEDLQRDFELSQTLRKLILESERL